jgi:hypothetical protein
MQDALISTAAGTEIRTTVYKTVVVRRIQKLPQTIVLRLTRAVSGGLSVRSARHTRRRTWNELGRFVKKGEKGILILARIVHRKTENEEDRNVLRTLSQPFAPHTSSTDYLVICGRAFARSVQSACGLWKVLSIAPSIYLLIFPELCNTRELKIDVQPSFCRGPALQSTRNREQPYDVSSG